MDIILSSHPSYSLYLKSYYNAVKVLFDYIAEKQIRNEDIAIPLLFLIRHSIEIGYKGNINYLANCQPQQDRILCKGCSIILYLRNYKYGTQQAGNSNKTLYCSCLKFIPLLLLLAKRYVPFICAIMI